MKNVDIPSNLIIHESSDRVGVGYMWPSADHPWIYGLQAISTAASMDDMGLYKAVMDHPEDYSYLTTNFVCVFLLVKLFLLS